MKILHYIPILILLLLSACTSDGNPLPEEEQGNVTFLFTTGSEMKTRTALNSSDNRQHVEKVHLFIFSGTDENATCEGFREIPWPAPSIVDYNTTERSYSITLEPGAYTFLAIGLDDKSGATYNLPAAITKGSTLANAKATLAQGKTTADIAVSELFAGWSEATVQATGNTAVGINLYRRVAGVLAYIKDIPTDVAKIQIKLYKNQYKDVPLKKANQNTDDHGNTELTDSRVLMNIPVNETELNKTELTDGHGYTVTKQPGTVLQGAYVLPIEAPTAGYTLTLETLDASDTILKTYNVKMLTTTENGGTTTETVRTNYPLLANQFYSIGKRNVEDGTDEPVSLGEDIYIRVDPIWEGISDDIPLE